MTLRTGPLSPARRHCRSRFRCPAPVPRGGNRIRGPKRSPLTGHPLVRQLVKGARLLPADRRDPPGRHAARRAGPVRPRREDPAPPTSAVPPEIRIERIVVNPPGPVGVPEVVPPPRGPARAAPRQSLDDYLTSRRR